MRKIWINRPASFKEAERLDRDYYLNMGATKRLEIVQFLRETCHKAKKILKDENRKRLRRIIKIVQ